MANITAAQQTQILKIVTGLFNGAPGATILTAMADAVAAGTTMQQLAQTLAGTSVFTQTVMGGKVTAAAQTTVLMNNFGLTYNPAIATTDTSSSAAIVQNIFFGQVQAGANFGDIVFLVTDFLSNPANAAAVAADSVLSGMAATLNNRAAVAEYYSATLGLNPSGSTVAAVVASMQTVVSTVTSTTPVATPAEIQTALAASGAIPAATYTLSNAAAVNEGSTATFALATTNVTNGTTVSYTVTGVEAGDVTATSGSVQVINNAATISVATVADLLTEGLQTMTVSITGTSATATGVINDTSLTPTYTLTAAAASSNEGASNTFTLQSSLATDTSTISYDLSGTGIAAADVTGGLTGTATLVAGTATITVAAAADATTEGTENYTVTAKDSAGTTVATATASIADTSLTPVLGADSVAGTIVNGQGTAIMTAADITALRNNDTTSTGAASTGTVTVDTTQTATGGQLVALANGNTMFVANTGTRQGSFVYSVSDIAGMTGTVNVTLNSAPVITSAATLAATEDNDATGTVTATDADSDTLTYTFGAATNGTVTAGANGAYTYKGNTNYNGTDTFKVTVSDGYTTATQDIAVTVAAVNDDPQVLTPPPADIAVKSGGTATADLSTYATDPDTGATLTYTVDAATKNGGTVTLGADGKTATITYAQGGGSAVVGADSFGMTVTDGVIVTPVAATVTLTVSNTAPTASALALSAKTGVTQTIDLAAGTSVAAGVTTTFTAPVVDAESNTLTPSITVGSLSAGGSAEVLNGKIVYTSTVGYVGTETLKYTVTDGFGGTSTEQTITFTVASNTGGTSGADTLYGSTAAEVIDGLAGNDTIVGGGGLDTITGGNGDDRVTFSNAAVQIGGSNGVDTIVINSDATSYKFDFTAALQDTSTQANIAKNSSGTYVLLSGFENIDATNAANAITIDAAATTTTSVILGAGNDTVTTLAAATGAVTVSGLDGDDAVTTGAFAGTSLSVDGGAGNDTITATNATASATLVGGAGNDSVLLGTGATSVTGGDGDDTITTHATNASNKLEGDAGNDTFKFISANLTSTDTIVGGTGTDTISLTDASTVVDADFTAATSTEVLTVAAATAQTVTLGALAMAAGLTTVTGGTTGVDTVTVGAGFTSALTVNVNTGSDNIDGSASAAALTISAAAASYDTNDTLKGGTGTGDVLSVTADAGAGALGANVSGFETITIVASGSNGAQITTANGNLGATKTMTINASALTNSAAVFTFVGSDESDGNYVITGGAGNDVITGAINTTSGANSIDGGSGNDVITAGAGADSVAGGAGNDTFSFVNANLTSTDTISGGAGTDTLSVSDASTVVDADFTLATSVEVLTEGTGNANQTITLGALAMAAGLTTITGNGTGVDTVTVGAGFTSALTVNVNTGNDKIDGSASAAALTIAAADASIDTNDTLTGGTGTGDVLSITAASGAAAFGANVTGFETITVVAATTNTVQITTNNANLGATKTMTINASALTDAAATFTFVGSDESDGNYVITGGAGNDVITGAINTTSGANSIDGGSGNDVITAGAGADSVAGGAGNDTFSFVSANLTSADTISGGAGTDTLSISDASTVVDADFTAATSVEVLTEGTANANQTITLGAAAMAAGLTTITGNGSGVDTVTVGAGFTSALTVTVNTGNDKIDGSASAAALTIALTETALDGSDTLIGGTSTGDIITLTADGASAVLGANFSGFETINIANNVATSITTVDANIASTKTLTVNAAALTSTALTLAGSAELDGNFSVTGGTVGDTITTGSGADTVDGGAGADNITGGAGVDSLTGGTGDDTIDGGTGIDVMVGGTGNDTIYMDDAAEAMDAGSDTADTLYVSFTGVGGALVVNLTSTTDQITMWDGSANSAVQLGFEHLNASSWNGGTGVDVTAVAAGSTIVGSAKTDVIRLGSAAAVDTITYGSTGSIVGTAQDSIINFATASDIIGFASLTLLAADATALAAGANVQQSAGGLLTFHASDNTLALMITAVQADAELDVAGSTAIFVFGADTYVYNAGAATGNADDQIVKLVGVSGASFDTITDLGTTMTIG